MEDIDRAEDRLGNIRSVEPILSALRTISHASWQTARRKLGEVHRVNNRIRRLMAVVPATLGSRTHTKSDVGERRILIAIGTQRGLCGAFNRVVANEAEQISAVWAKSDQQASFWVVGSRLARIFRSKGLAIDREWQLSSSSLPSYALAVDIFQTCLLSFQDPGTASIEIIYNRPLKGTLSETTLETILPPQALREFSLQREHLWPPPIIETDPIDLMAHLFLEGLSIQVLLYLLESAEAEHSVRFHLMEEASQNAERIIDELNEIVLSARRQAITNEMTELATSSGLLGPRE